MTALAALARRLVLPTLMTGVMLAILVGLGVWQLQRLQWKLGILAAIDHAEAAAPVPLAGDPGQFTKVVATGVWDPAAHGLYGVDVRDVTAGSYLIEALDRPGQAPVLVDLGFVPDGFSAFPSGPATVVGYVRQPAESGLFTPADDAARRHFYTLDPAKMGAALGLARVAPFTLIAMGDPNAIPSPATALPRPPNDHFGYALTWFGLAATLAVTFGLYVRKTLRP
jgi:surfeit locus 1 family protein